MSINRPALGIPAALAAAIAYGFVTPLARYAFSAGGIKAAETAFVRTGLVAVILACLALLAHQSLRVPRAAAPVFWGLALATFTVSTCYVGSVQFIPAGLSAIIFYTFPIVILLLSPVIEGRAPQPVALAIAAVGFAGLGIALGGDVDRLDWRGCALAGVAVLGVVGQFFFGRKLSAYMPTLATGGLVHLAILPLAFGLLLIVQGPELRVLHSAMPVVLAVLAVAFFYMCGFFAQMTAVRLAPASIVAPFFNLEPIVTAAVSTIVLNEPLHGLQYAGGGLVLASLVAAALYDRRSVPA